ncbi:hypothetical protein B0I35DRAFT_429519 [Stachybotrys elegans]|uniref:Uncharacterized protein n=1 Tax=Stachybotrys elegans TaxID=80388 RepID=A0A8K0WR68_9HYPO|nr:hypothetical protein B0I35DRAFT_429519 [Stachybotrys elegans]
MKLLARTLHLFQAQRRMCNHDCQGPKPTAFICRSFIQPSVAACKESSQNPAAHLVLSSSDPRRHTSARQTAGQTGKSYTSAQDYYIEQQKTTTPTSCRSSAWCGKQMIHVRACTELNRKKNNSPPPMPLPFRVTQQVRRRRIIPPSKDLVANTVSGRQPATHDPARERKSQARHTLVYVTSDRTSCVSRLKELRSASDGQRGRAVDVGWRQAVDV